jgi:hypothetical protein
VKKSGTGSGHTPQNSGNFEDWPVPVPIFLTSSHALRSPIMAIQPQIA